MYFNSADDLIDAFSIKSDEKFENITPLGNRKVGFSVQIKYPENIRYRPPKKSDGTDDTFALLHVVYAHPIEMPNSNVESNKIPLFITIVPYSRYRANHFDYNFEDQDCPTKESLEVSKSSPRPVELEYANEYFYDHDRQSFTDKRGVIITGIKILEQIMDDHCKTIKGFFALKLKFKLRSRSVIVNILSIFINVLLWTITNIFGRTLDRNTGSSSLLEGYKKENLKKLSTDSLNIFGYKAARRVIVFFCGIVAISFAIIYSIDLKPKYLKQIASNNFLALTHTIIALWVLDVLVPVLFFYAINMLIKLRKKMIFHKFKAL